MSGLILPGGHRRRNPAHALTIHLPSGYQSGIEQAEDQGGHICRVLVDAEEERICGTTFALDDEAGYLRHLRQCVSDHRDVIHAASPRTKMPWLDPEAWDPEIDEHMRKVGERMLEEGRFEVKPSERAGF